MYQSRTPVPHKGMPLGKNSVSLDKPMLQSLPNKQVATEVLIMIRNQHSRPPLWI